MNQSTSNDISFYYYAVIGCINRLSIELGLVILVVQRAKTMTQWDQPPVSSTQSYDVGSTRSYEANCEFNNLSLFGIA